MATLERAGLLTRGPGRGSVWRVTPLGRARLLEMFDEGDLPALVATLDAESHTELGGYSHPVVPVSLAPPELTAPRRDFLARHTFDTNVFAMTRFPVPKDEDAESQADGDPVAPALAVAREACERHGLELHLASDRAMSDDLWSNVAAHMWASKYGIAFFEDRADKGLNYNMTIEVGSMLMTGRRSALLKDVSIERMPTDLVGRIYKEIDLDDPGSVAGAVEDWIVNDLGLT
jgi:hypothetical protein